MDALRPTETEIPSRRQTLVFQGKARLLQLHRTCLNGVRRAPKHRHGPALHEAPILAEVRAPLWREIGPAEFPLTAGKVENLRRAASAFDGLEIPAHAVFSFWRQLGRITRSKGFVQGRELREGCLIPSLGGGLCQLSGLLYQAALQGGLEIVERHAHSRSVPGSDAERDLDATVFWNYVDLQFRSEKPWRLEVALGVSDLVVRLRSQTASPRAPAPPPISTSEPAPRASPSGDCQTCGVDACFRHPTATLGKVSSIAGHSTFLLDARWPEFDAWCAEHSRESDVWFLPLDGRRWKKPNYQWSPPTAASIRHATSVTLWRSFRQRRLPAQGARRQRTLLEGDTALARRYASMLSPRCRHVVVSQNLLPHLWKTGALGGRSFDVLMLRWPMAELQRRLNAAKEAHPASTTLDDFRADPDLIRAESEALSAAGRLITPHRALARHLGPKAWLVDWEMPAALNHRAAPSPKVFFPASPLGRKGAFELAEAVQGLDVDLHILGRASEDSSDPLAGNPRCVHGTVADLADACAVVLPAWIEHQPRLALLALASGIPVIATEACGLPDHPRLHTLASPNAETLRRMLLAVLEQRDCLVS